MPTSRIIPDSTRRALADSIRLCMQGRNLEILGELGVWNEAQERRIVELAGHTMRNRAVITFRTIAMFWRNVQARDPVLFEQLAFRDRESGEELDARTPRVSMLYSRLDFHPRTYRRLSRRSGRLPPFRLVCDLCACGLTGKLFALGGMEAGSAEIGMSQCSICHRMSNTTGITDPERLTLRAFEFQRGHGNISVTVGNRLVPIVRNALGCLADRPNVRVRSRLLDALECDDPSRFEHVWGLFYAAYSDYCYNHNVTPATLPDGTSPWVSTEPSAFPDGESPTESAKNWKAALLMEMYSKLAFHAPGGGVR